MIPSRWPDEPRPDWMITRCDGGGCIHLHIERTVITMTPEEMVALAQLINRAVEEYRLNVVGPLAPPPEAAH